MEAASLIRNNRPKQIESCNLSIGRQKDNITINDEEKLPSEKR